MSVEFFSLMKSAYDAHREFKDAWNRLYRNKNLVEPKEVTKARDRFRIENDKLFDHINKYEAEFFEGDPEAINSILNFLEVDIPAFRCGYAKEKFYRRLKSMSLDREQIERIQNIAYKQCESGQFRREFRDLTRLMIKLADESVLGRLSSIAESSEGAVKLKTEKMIEAILLNRKDLK